LEDVFGRWKFYILVECARSTRHSGLNLACSVLDTGESSLLAQLDPRFRGCVAMSFRGEAEKS